MFSGNAFIYIRVQEPTLLPSCFYSTMMDCLLSLPLLASQSQDRPSPWRTSPQKCQVTTSASPAMRWGPSPATSLWLSDLVRAVWDGGREGGWRPEGDWLGIQRVSWLGGEPGSLFGVSHWQAGWVDDQMLLSQAPLIWRLAQFPLLFGNST